MRCSQCEAELTEGARFCGNCGAPVEAAPPQQKVLRPIRTGRPRLAPRSRSRWLIPALLALFLALAAVAVAAVVIFVRPDFLPNFLPLPRPGGELVLYATQEQGINTLPNTLTVMKPDGTETIEVAHDRAGLWLPENPYAWSGYLASGSHLIAYYEPGGEGWQLSLASLDDATPLLSDDRALRTGGPYQGFSPDGRRFAYTAFDEASEAITLYVVDEGGNELLAVPGAVFGGFFPDNERLLVLETDEEGLFNSLAQLDLASGGRTPITDLAESSGWVRPLISLDGQQLYYYADNELLARDVAGGTVARVHEFDSQHSTVFFSPDHRLLAIFDQFEESTLGELRLVDPADNRPTRVDSDVNLLPASNHLGEPAVAFSPDSDLVAYLTEEPGNLSLYVVGTDGRDRRRLSNDNAWIAFAFSPNGQQIAYIEGEEMNEAGALYIANVDGSERLRLDVDVWSFRFAPNGRSLVYSTVENLDQGEPESQMYRVRSDGEGQELIADFQDGLITILGWFE